MKRYVRCAAQVWSLGMFGLATTVPLSARADCLSPVIGSDTAFISRVDPALVTAHQALYDSKVYNLMQDGPPLVDGNGQPIPYWGDGPWRHQEAKSHFYATLLINHGIVGPNPPLRQNAGGVWEYDPDAFDLSVSFHRSWDGYAPLAFDIGAYGCQEVHPATGAQFCDPYPTQWRPSFPTYGGGVGSGVADDLTGQPPGSGSTAQNRSIWDLFKDPDRQLQYACGALDDTSGIVAIARTIVHESWHSTQAPNHSDGTNTPAYSGPLDNKCTNGKERCDTFVWDATGSGRKYAGLVEQQWEGVGSYQVEQEFTCDLVEAGAEWLPLETQIMAQQYFYIRANMSRFVNVDPDPTSTADPTGILPFTCGAPESVLSVPVDGTTTCPGTSQLRCSSDADCNDGDPGTFDDCVSLCCMNTVVK